jgi:predicted  nucleic acid-binding Zn-ribbon protein
MTWVEGRTVFRDDLKASMARAHAAEQELEALKGETDAKQSKIDALEEVVEQQRAETKRQILYRASERQLIVQVMQSAGSNRRVHPGP